MIDVVLEWSCSYCQNHNKIQPIIIPSSFTQRNTSKESMNEQCKCLVIEIQILLLNSKNLEENLVFDQRSLILFLQGLPSNLQLHRLLTIACQLSSWSYLMCTRHVNNTSPPCCCAIEKSVSTFTLFEYFYHEQTTSQVVMANNNDTGMQIYQGGHTQHSEFDGCLSLKISGPTGQLKKNPVSPAKWKATIESTSGFRSMI